MSIHTSLDNRALVDHLQEWIVVVTAENDGEASLGDLGKGAISRHKLVSNRDNSVNLILDLLIVLHSSVDDGEDLSTPEGVG